MSWGSGEHQLGNLHHWLRQLPAEIMGSRPRLCLACVSLLVNTAPHSLLYAWLDAAEARLLASRRTQPPLDASLPTLTEQERQEQQNLLGEVMAHRAFLQSFEAEGGQATLALCQQALAFLSADNTVARIFVAQAQMMTFYVSSPNDAVTAVHIGLQGSKLVQQAGLTTLGPAIMGLTSYYLIGAVQLHEAYQQTQQAIIAGTTKEGQCLPQLGLLPFTPRSCASGTN